MHLAKLFLGVYHTSKLAYANMRSVFLQSLIVAMVHEPMFAVRSFLVFACCWPHGLLHARPLHVPKRQANNLFTGGQIQVLLSISLADTVFPKGLRFSSVVVYKNLPLTRWSSWSSMQDMALSILECSVGTCNLYLDPPPECSWGRGEGLIHCANRTLGMC